MVPAGPTQGRPSVLSRMFGKSTTSLVSQPSTAMSVDSAPVPSTLPSQRGTAPPTAASNVVAVDLDARAPAPVGSTTPAGAGVGAGLGTSSTGTGAASATTVTAGASRAPAASGTQATGTPAAAGKGVAEAPNAMTKRGGTAPAVVYVRGDPDHPDYLEGRKVCVIGRAVVVVGGGGSGDGRFETPLSLWTGFPALHSAACMHSCTRHMHLC